MSNVISQHWTLDQEKLEAFVLSKLNKKEMSLLATHLEKCDECSKRVQEEREVRAGIRRFGRMEMKRRLKLHLRRDQGRRFEWTNVASLAAAIVVMLGAVFVIRWFIDFEQKKTKSVEIILSENKESKPAERALWIIGRVIEISDKSSESGVSTEENQIHAIADNLKDIPGPALQNEPKVGEESRSIVAASPIEESEVTVMAERKTLMNDVTSSVAKAESGSTVRSDSELRASAPAEADQISKSIAQEKPESAYFSRSGVSSGQLRELEEPKSGDTIKSMAKGRTAPSTQSDSESLANVTIAISDLKSQIVSNMPHLRKVIPPASKPASIGEGKADSRDRAIAKQKSLFAMKKRRPAKNIIVRRGNMKDLPDTLRMTDATAIQTKLERTPKGVLLTFYSSAIKDTSATFVEAVTADSIIVFFRSKQIAYYIPGGLSGGT
jgi:hypothetical protein